MSPPPNRCDNSLFLWLVHIPYPPHRSGNSLFLNSGCPISISRGVAVLPPFLNSGHFQFPPKCQFPPKWKTQCFCNQDETHFTHTDLDITFSAFQTRLISTPDICGNSFFLTLRHTDFSHQIDVYNLFLVRVRHALFHPNKLGNSPFLKSARVPFRPNQICCTFPQMWPSHFPHTDVEIHLFRNPDMVNWLVK